MQHWLQWTKCFHVCPHVFLSLGALCCLSSNCAFICVNSFHHWFYLDFDIFNGSVGNNNLFCFLKTLSDSDNSLNCGGLWTKTFLFPGTLGTSLFFMYNLLHWVPRSIWTLVDQGVGICVPFKYIPWKEADEVKRFVWASICWSSSHTRVTSQKSGLYLRSWYDLLVFCRKSFKYNKNFSE